MPLFLLFGVIFFCSLTVHAAPSPPDSVKLTAQKNRVAINSTVNLTASPNPPGSGVGDFYEYCFKVKSPSNNTWITLSDYSRTNTISYQVNERGQYNFQVLCRCANNDGTKSQIVTKETGVYSVDPDNTSTISSSNINLGESVTINASATGTSTCKYFYECNSGGGFTPLSPSTSSSNYTASASATFKPTNTGNYTLRVTIKDDETGATKSKQFSITVGKTTLINKCSLSKTEVDIQSNNTSVSLLFDGENGAPPYKYRAYYTLNGVGVKNLLGDSTHYYSVPDGNIQFELHEVGKYVITFAVRDSANTTVEKKITLNATCDLQSTSNISSYNITNRSTVTLVGSATGGSGEYEYKFSYFLGGKENIISQYSSGNSSTFEMDRLLGEENKNFTGTMTFRVYVRDKHTLGATAYTDFKVSVSEATAADFSRTDLFGLFREVTAWESTLNEEQRTNLRTQVNYIQARDRAYNALSSNLIVDYTEVYFHLYNQWNVVKNTSLDGPNFFLVQSINHVTSFYSNIISSVGDWLSNFANVNVDTGTYKFDLEGFVNEFSRIFVIFATSLIVVLFGINIIKTALEYELFTLKGAVKVFARLILAEIWIQLSTKICIMVVKIFNELMNSIIHYIVSSGTLKSITFTFKVTRSGTYLIGDIVDFLKNLVPFLFVLLLIGTALVIFVIVYIKLIIRSLEIAMLSVVSPVFFACSVGEATMPYFRKFITAFLSVGAEIVFMGVVYLALLWYCKGVTVNPVNLNDLYNITSSGGTFYTYIAVSVACGIMMIRPPQVLKDLLR